MGKSIMKQRDLQPERMDDPDLPTEDHLHALQGLARLNRFSRIEPSSFRSFEDLGEDSPMENSGFLMWRVDRGMYPFNGSLERKPRGLGIRSYHVDNRSTACDEQQRLAAKKVSERIRFSWTVSSALPGGFDVVTCSLFFHHLKNFEVFQLLQAIQAASSGGLVLCDLERSWMNLQMVRLLPVASPDHPSFTKTR